MAAHTEQVDGATLWGGNGSPFRISYGKQMMWFFLLSDALTFGALLTAYGYARHQAVDWPVAEDVFNAMPFLDGHYPLMYVALMTFILIVSSVTMVLAVEAGHRLDKKGVIKWMAFTVIGGAFFVGSQAWEWAHFIHGTANGGTVEGMDTVIYGANLLENEYAPLAPQFADFFFFITGFHGFHVFSGVVINLIVLIQVMRGTYDDRGHFEMVEKVGLYWHFVDLVWVFVFTFFYLI